MNKIIAIFFVLCFVSNHINGQTDSPDGNLLNVNKSAMRDKTRDDKEEFGGYFISIFSLISQDSTSTFTFQPTLYALAKIFDSEKVSSQSHYRHEAFIRNFQLNLGLSPQSSFNNLVKSLQIGGTYAILNNKKISYKEYANSENMDSFKYVTDLITSLDSFVISLVSNQSATTPDSITIDQENLFSIYMNDPKNFDTTMLHPKIREYLRNHFHISNANKIPTFEKLFNPLKESLKTKSLLTVTNNSFYDALKNRWKNIDFSGNFSIYPFHREPYKKPSTVYFDKLSLTFKAKYSTQNDTLYNNSNLQRHLMTGSFDANFPIKLKHKGKWKTYMEIKPGAAYTNVIDGLYKSEDQSKLDAQITFRFDISDNFNIPITIVKNTKHPQFFGFLSIQYSLK